MTTKDNLTDYIKAKLRVRHLPQFYLGQEVMTKKYEKGIIVELMMNWNGFYINPESSSALVWFSTETPNNEGMVTQTYSLNQIRPVFKD